MLINCVAYENGHKIADIQTTDISDYLARPGCFVWVALRDPDDGELEQMQDEFGLHELAVEDASHGHQRPKIEEYGASLFVVMHTVEFAPDDSLQEGEIHIFVGPNYLLSIRNRSRHNLLSVRTRCEREPELLQKGSGFVLYALMDAIVDQYFPVVQEFENRLELVEAEIFEQKTKPRKNIRQLYKLKQDVMELRHAVTPMLDAVSKLAGGRPPKPCEGMQEYFRDIYDHLSRINTSVEYIRETITTATQVNLAMVAIEEGEVNKRLAAWAGIFAVATAFAGIWGMNFEVMPELQWKYGYPAALTMITLTVFGLAGAFPLAILLALGRNGRLPVVRTLCTVFIELVRGVPLVAVLFMAAFLFPLFMPKDWEFPSLLRVLVAIILFAGAYMAEVIRGGLLAVPKGQAEVAQALGLSYWQVQLSVVLPQALRNVLPALMNSAIALFKDTSLVIIVGLFELTGALGLAVDGDPKWRAFALDGYLFIALIYWVGCFAMSRYSRSLETRN